MFKDVTSNRLASPSFPSRSSVPPTPFVLYSNDLPSEVLSLASTLCHCQYILAEYTLA